MAGAEREVHVASLHELNLQPVHDAFGRHGCHGVKVHRDADAVPKVAGDAESIGYPVGDAGRLQRSHRRRLVPREKVVLHILRNDTHIVLELAVVIQLMARTRGGARMMPWNPMRPTCTSFAELLLEVTIKSILCCGVIKRLPAATCDTVMGEPTPPSHGNVFAIT
ncbi:hypothetical protein KC357_g24 [Hortaea werneckii]|nr:hypothetical protein KC357_g24 [Hortaea werneckii]